MLEFVSLISQSDLSDSQCLSKTDAFAACRFCRLETPIRLKAKELFHLIPRALRYDSRIQHPHITINHLFHQQINFAGRYMNVLLSDFYSFGCGRRAHLKLARRPVKSLFKIARTSLTTAIFFDPGLSSLVSSAYITSPCCLRVN